MVTGRINLGKSPQKSPGRVGQKQSGTKRSIPVSTRKTVKHTPSGRASQNTRRLPSRRTPVRTNNNSGDDEARIQFSF